MSKKQYEITTVNDFVDLITDEKIENITISFAQWLYFVLRLCNQLRESRPEETKGKTNSQLLDMKFIWNDDNKIGLNKITVTDGDGNEIDIVRKPK